VTRSAKFNEPHPETVLDEAAEEAETGSTDEHTNQRLARLELIADDEGTFLPSRPLAGFRGRANEAVIRPRFFKIRNAWDR
jgi:hypothetical protein